MASLCKHNIMGNTLGAITLILSCESKFFQVKVLIFFFLFYMLVSKLWPQVLPGVLWITLFFFFKNDSSKVEKHLPNSSSAAGAMNQRGNGRQRCKLSYPGNGRQAQLVPHGIHGLSTSTSEHFKKDRFWTQFVGSKFKYELLNPVLTGFWTWATCVLRKHSCG